MLSYSLFVVDDEKALADGLALNLEHKYRTRVFYSAAPALEALEKEPPDLVLMDIRMPGMDGLESLERIKAINPDVLVIMVTAFDDTETVVRAMKLGAHDYVVKPIQVDLLEVAIQKALDSIRMRKEVQLLQERALRENLPLFVGRSQAIQSVMGFVRSVAKSPDTPVLILGESGTGKELVSSAIHYRSPNYKGPLVQVNCAAVPENLIESELFGYVKGAFSGAATSGKKGLIEEAEGGTLFLDEIGDLSLDAQAKLLRFLDSGQFFRVGSTKSLSVKTRIVSATNRDLDAMVAEGTFREDFYFRIGVIKVTIPSLNQRRADIVPIAEKFLVEFAEKFGKPFTGISPEAARALEAFHWKGNIRELRNVMERAALVEEAPTIKLPEMVRAMGGASESPSPGDAPRDALIPEEGLDLEKFLENVEQGYLKKALDMAGSNEADAARLLRMKYTTFRYRKRKLLGG